MHFRPPYSPLLLTFWGKFGPNLESFAIKHFLKMGQIFEGSGSLKIHNTKKSYYGVLRTHIPASVVVTMISVALSTVIDAVVVVTAFSPPAEPDSSMFNAPAMEAHRLATAAVSPSPPNISSMSKTPPNCSVMDTGTSGSGCGYTYFKNRVGGIYFKVISFI